MARNAGGRLTPGRADGGSWWRAPAPIVGVGLKMFLDHRKALRYLAGLGAHEELWQRVRLFVLPTFTELDAASRMLPAGVVYGAQDGHWEEAGAFTGAVSPRSLKQLGCAFVEIGHAERLRWFGEPWEVACRKTAAVVGAGLVPLICVGERRVTSAPQARKQVEAQLVAALEAAEGSAVIVAYEPCWAIGADEAAAVNHVAVVVERIRELLDARPQECAVLYGGSVTAGSVGELMKAPIDGVFIGRAATSVPGLVKIVHRVLSARAGRPVDTGVLVAP